MNVESIKNQFYCSYSPSSEWLGEVYINMNARLYDPVVGRFLSPDPIIKNPFNTQDFNRYSYCINNPLKYVDLSGMYYDPRCAYKRNYKSHKGVGDSMSNKPDKDWGVWGVNGSHNRWDGFGAGWGDGRGFSFDGEGDYNLGFNGGVLGGGGFGGKNNAGNGGGGGGIDFTFGYSGVGSSHTPSNVIIGDNPPDEEKIKEKQKIPIVLYPTFIMLKLLYLGPGGFHFFIEDGQGSGFDGEPSGNDIDLTLPKIQNPPSVNFMRRMRIKGSDSHTFDNGKSYNVIELRNGDRIFVNFDANGNPTDTTVTGWRVINGKRIHQPLPLTDYYRNIISK